MATVAAAESWKPTERTSSGSTSSRPPTARASTRSLVRGDPGVVSTGASGRHRGGAEHGGLEAGDSANSPTTTRVTSRASATAGAGAAPGPPGQDEGDVLPETASRWVRPAPRKSSARSGGWCAVVAEHEAGEERPLGGRRATPPRPPASDGCRWRPGHGVPGARRSRPARTRRRAGEVAATRPRRRPGQRRQRPPDARRPRRPGGRRSVVGRRPSARSSSRGRRPGRRPGAAPSRVHRDRSRA